MDMCRERVSERKVVLCLWMRSSGAPPSLPLVSVPEIILLSEFVIVKVHLKARLCSGCDVHRDYYLETSQAALYLQTFSRGK